jgi:hypothetical protein
MEAKVKTMPFNHPVPSLKYVTFLDAFEEMVTQKQKEINDMREMEQVYSICSNALNFSEISVPVKVIWGPGWIRMQSNLTKETCIDTYKFLREIITTRLFEAGLIGSDKIPEARFATYLIFFTWRIERKGKMRPVEVDLRLEIPYAYRDKVGASKYIDITTREETNRYTIPRFRCTEPGYEHEWE